MNKDILNVLRNCKTAYSLGETYVLSEQEKHILNEELNIGLLDNTIDDYTFDLIYSEAKKLWPTDQFFNELTSENVGYGIDITHAEPMGSMDELKAGDWDKWKIGHNKFILTDKLDGCSIVLTYDKGEIIQAATRGRGLVGKCILRHLYMIKNIPLKIPFQENIVIRGELLCPKNEIKQMLDDTERVTGKRQKNGRNTIAGALNRKETQFSIFSHSKFVAYWDSIDKGQNIEKLKTYGFTIPYLQHISGNTTEEELVAIIKKRLIESEFEIDGIILTQEDNPEQGYIGSSLNPKASRKLKLGIYDNVATSIVTNIIWQISKHGALKPVLEIKPTEVCGCTVTHITGHNYENVMKTCCGIGAKIKFCRAGLVIPYLQEVLETSTNFNLPKFYIKRGVDIYLDKDKDITGNLDEQKIKQLEYFGKKLEIEQLGYANCKKLYEALQVEEMETTPEYVLLLPNGFITAIIGENGKKIEKSLTNIKQNLSQSKLAAACGAFGPSIGEKILETVFNKYNTLDVSRDQLLVLDGFAENRVKQYEEYLPNWLNIYAKVLNGGIQFSNITHTITSDKFKDKIVCFSGIRDKDLINYINENGGEASDNWKKTTNILVVKDLNSTSSKMSKAKASNCLILSIEQAKEYFYG